MFEYITNNNNKKKHNSNCCCYWLCFISRYFFAASLPATKATLCLRQKRFAFLWRVASLLLLLLHFLVMRRDATTTHYALPPPLSHTLSVSLTLSYGTSSSGTHILFSLIEWQSQSS